MVAAMLRGVALGSAFAVAACGGSGGDYGDAGFCASIGGAETHSCTSCSVENGPAVVDGNLGSAASITMAPNLTATIRGTSSAEFGTDGRPIVLFSPPNLAAATLQITLNTYRNEVLRDSAVVWTGTGSSNTCTSCGENGSGQSFAGLAQVTQSYDAVEVVLTLSGASADAAMPVYELCRQ